MQPQGATLPSRGSLAEGAGTAEDPSVAIAFEHVHFSFDDHVVLNDLSFTIPRASMSILLGASGAGKSVILKLILGLLKPDAGTILVNGHRVDQMTEKDLMGVRADIGMLFQENALFDSLTVAGNVGYRLSEELRMPEDEVRERVVAVLGFVGLGEFPERLPSELSGGQRRRVGLARAMAAKPSLLLLDDPTTGLDPVIATSVDDEIIKLRDIEHVTSLLVTHQIRDAFYVARHHAVSVGEGVEIRENEGDVEHATFKVLHEGRIFFEGSGAELLASKDAYLREFLFMTLPPW